MSKKRKTRREKIIARLKRNIQTQKVITVETKGKTKSESLPKETSLYTFDPKLIKHDLVKTAIFSIFFLSLIFILFIFFEKNGETLLNSLFTKN